MQFSHSRVETFETCPHRYKMRYVDKLETIPNTEDAANALFLGTALHEGVEKGVKDGIQKYFDSYPIISDLHINEAIKLEHWIPKVQDLVHEMCNGKTPVFEHKIDHPDLVGFMDLLIPIEEDGDFKKFALYDFKYSNNVERYLKSRQLSEYKHFYEKLNPFHEIVEMGFIFIPKTAIRQKKTEDLGQFRKRLKETLDGMEIKVVKVDFNQAKVIDFYQKIKEILECTSFQKNECRLCDFCEYKDYCQKGVDFMILPSTQRRQINKASRKKVWLYGAPFSGKTTLADNFPTPIMLNTDGNINSFTAPMIEVKETLDGRQKISGWVNFKAAIDELQKGSDFETIVVDLVEDTLEHCRRYCYEKLGIEHESDAGFGKGYDFIRTEFLTTMKKLLTLDYNIVLISHEDLSKDISKKGGDKVTSIRPNIQEKTALKLAGMVDIVARVVADGNSRTLQFKSDDVVFGGGRLKLTETVIPLSYEALECLYANQETKEVAAPQNEPTNNGSSGTDEVQGEVVENVGSTVVEAEAEQEQPVRRTRRIRS